MRKVFTDKDGGLLVQLFDGSKRYIDLDDQVIRAVSGKFGDLELDDLEPKHKPITRLMHPDDLAGWWHDEGCAICPDCNEWVVVLPVDDMLNTVITIISHECKPGAREAWAIANRRNNAQK